MQVAAHPRTTAKIGPVNRELFVVQRDQVNSVLALGQPQSPMAAQKHIFHQKQRYLGTTKHQACMRYVVNGEYIWRSSPAFVVTIIWHRLLLIFILIE